MSEGLSIEMGVVGWFPDDGSDHAQVSDAEIGGRTLVKVTLIRGGMPDDIPPNGEARGIPIRARVMGPTFYVPPKGTEVVVAFPAGFQQTPGAAIILGTLGATPEIQYSDTKAKMDFGPDIDLVIKARSVTLVSYNDTAPDSYEDFIAVGPDSGIHLGSKDGHGLLIKDDELSAFISKSDDAKAVLRMSDGKIELVTKDSSDKICKLEMGDLTFSFASEKFYAFANTGILGISLPSGVPTPLLVGFTGPGVPSTGWCTCAL